MSKIYVNHTFITFNATGKLSEILSDLYTIENFPWPIGFSILYPFISFPDLFCSSDLFILNGLFMKWYFFY